MTELHDKGAKKRTYSHDRVNVPDVVDINVLNHGYDGVRRGDTGVARSILLYDEGKVKLDDGNPGDRTGNQSVAGVT